MLESQRRWATLWRSSLAILLGAATGAAFAADHVLVVGGGPDAHQSQVSLEENVLYLHRILPSMGWGDSKRTLLFASGAQAVPDVCVAVDASTFPLHQKLGEVFGQTKGMELTFRHNRLSPDGPATRDAVLARLSELANELSADDRLLIYVTGHGGKGTPDSNGYFYTWTRERIHVREFTACLDRFDPQVTVLVVMVQCYGGSFANIVFTGGDRTAGLSPHRRAGFFATVATRPASGCTAEESPHALEEYSTYFWGALSGIRRDGGEYPRPDMDGDGVVSGAEAHAHTLIEAKTIDFGLRTSDWFATLHAPQDRRDGRLFQFDRDFSRLVAVAPPAEREVLNQLSKELALGGENRISEAVRSLEQVEYEHLGHREEIAKLQSQRDVIRRRIADELTTRWPTLKNPWHPENQVLLQSEAQAVLAVIQQHPDHDQLVQLESQMGKREELDQQNQEQFAKLQRYIRTAQAVAFAYNLKTAGDPEHWKKFEQLVEIENSFLQVPIPEGHGRASDAGVKRR